METPEGHAQIQDVCLQPATTDQPIQYAAPEYYEMNDKEIPELPTATTASSSDWSQFEAAQSLIGLQGNTAQSTTQPGTPSTDPGSMVDPAQIDGSVVQPQVSQIDGTIVQPQITQIDGSVIQPQATQMDGTVVQQVSLNLPMSVISSSVYPTSSSGQSGGPSPVPSVWLQGQRIVSTDASPVAAILQSEVQPFIHSQPSNPILHSRDERTLNQVVRTIEKEDSSVSSSTRTPSSKPFFCNICERRFSQKTNISRHMMLHTGIRPYRCSTCEKGFIQSQSLRQHRLRHHPEEPVGSISPVINRSLVNRKTLTQQLMQQDPPTSGTWSPGVDMELGNIDLPSVMNIEKNSPPSSDVKSDEQKLILINKKLKEAEHSKPTKVFSCPVCGRTFTRKINMHVHLKKHTDSKPYKCTVCEAAFAQTIALKNHMMKIHGSIVNYRTITEQMFADSTTPKTTTLVTTTTMEEQQQHPMIPSNTSVSVLPIQQTLENSPKTLQSLPPEALEETVYSCRICGVNLSSQSSLDQHLRTHMISPSSSTGKYIFTALLFTIHSFYSSIAICSIRIC